MSRTKNVLALVVSLILSLATFGVASAYVDMFDVVLGLGPYLGGGHWQISIDNASFIRGNDNVTWITHYFGAYIDPAGTYPFTAFGAYTNSNGNTWVAYTRDGGDLVCDQGFLLASGMCIGYPGQFGTGLDDMVTYEINFINGVWYFQVFDINENQWFQVAHLNYNQRTINYPRARSAQVWASTNYWQPLSAMFSHPRGWAGGPNPQWVDALTGSAFVSNDNPADDGFCPYHYAFFQPALDSRVWITGELPPGTPSFCTKANMW